jgi:hypothetical protein
MRILLALADQAVITRQVIITGQVMDLCAGRRQMPTCGRADKPGSTRDQYMPLHLVLPIGKRTEQRFVSPKAREATASYSLKTCGLSKPMRP